MTYTYESKAKRADTHQQVDIRNWLDDQDLTIGVIDIYSVKGVMHLDSLTSSLI